MLPSWHPRQEWDLEAPVKLLNVMLHSQAQNNAEQVGGGCGAVALLGGAMSDTLGSPAAPWVRRRARLLSGVQRVPLVGAAYLPLVRLDCQMADF